MSSSAEIHVAYQVGNAPIRQFPFPQIYVEDVLPEDFYRRLREQLPPKEHFDIKVKEDVVAPPPTASHPPGTDVRFSF